MKKRTSWKRFLIGCLLPALVAGCAIAEPETPTPEPTATPLPPTRTPIPPTATSVPPTETPKPPSCEEVEGVCLELTFEDESCTYEGPTELETGTVTLLFFNESESPAAANLVRHTGDETIQDMLDTFVDGYSEGHAPSWTVSVHGVWRMQLPGHNHTWNGVLVPGIHTMVCARQHPWGVWFATGLTVKE